MADINELKRRCLAEIDARREEIIALGEDVYKTPELGFKEFRTTARVAEAFRAAGLEPETEIAYTGCKVSTPEAEGPRVAVMGELDCIVCAEHPDCAPNGNIHACGHNVQLANLFGSAVGILKSGVMDQLSGGVDFIAIPSEECADFEYRDGLIDKGEIAFYGGKPEYLRRGGLDKVDMVLQCHMLEMTEKGKLCTVSTDTNGFIAKTVRFIGVGSHAGFAPSEGVNALNMAQLALNNIHALRETFRDEDKVRVSAIITEGGGLVNVVPSSVRMEIMVRAFSLEAMMDASRKVDRALKAGALAIGGKVEINQKIGYMPLKADRRLSRLYRSNMIAFGGADEDSFVEVYQTAGSTDLGDLSQLMPCMHVWAGGVTGGLHTKDYRLADPETAYILPAKMLALTVIDLLYNGAEEAKSIVAAYKPAFTKESYLEFIKAHSRVDLFDGSAL